MDLKTFQAPPKSYREVPFMSWNDALDSDELRRQIGLIDTGGWGGFFMHARIGLKTPYLGKSWMENVRASVDEARKRGLHAWLYDEDKWPSGFAGGLAVTNPAHRSQTLLCLVDTKPALLMDRLAAFSAERSHHHLEDFVPITNPDRFDGDRQSLIQFVVMHSPLGAIWYNGYTYADLLNPEAVRAFLDSTYERYAAEFGNDFGQTIPGIFTDEPAYLNTGVPDLGVMEPGNIQGIPWTTDLPNLFEQRWGYDLLPHLPELFFDTGSYPTTRYHFWRLVTERFVSAYSRQLAIWCNEHQLQLTGHYLLEDTLWVQTRWIGAAMPHYVEQHIPGIDKLCRTINQPLTVKQLDSVVCQLGKPRALCESYGAAGQTFSFKGRKWIGDWLYVLGVTLNNPHLSLYSMRGERKRDYPANLFFQQPWWPENTLIANYFARLSYALSQGQRVVDLLILHPIGSAWSRYRPDAQASVGVLDSALEALEYILLRGHRDFHFGDELLMETHAAVEISNGNPVLCIGQMRYRVVIIPYSFTWTRETIVLVTAFIAQGGLVIALTPLPTEIEGQFRPGIFPSNIHTVALDKLLNTLDTFLPAEVHIEDAPDIWYHQRREGKTDWYFFCNTSQERSYTTTVTLHSNGRLETWDPINGAIHALPGFHDTTATFTLDLSPAGSQLVVLYRDQPPLQPPVRPLQQADITLALEDHWELKLLEANTLTLDWLTIRINAGDWSDPLYVLDAHQRIRQAGEGVDFDLRFTVDMQESLPESPLFLLIEDPEHFTITINDQAIAVIDQGWWCDPGFRKIEITGHLVMGSNTINLQGRFDRDTEIESIYLLGHFGVRMDERQFVGTLQGQSFYQYGSKHRLGRLPTHVTGGDLTSQGLPFLAGRVHLSQSFTLDAIPSAGTILFTQQEAAVAHVRINGTEIGMLAWEPYTLLIGDLLHVGENTIEVELVTTLRNLLGPHHRAGGDPEGVSPLDFRRTMPWTDNYVMTPVQVGQASILLTYEEARSEKV